MADDLRHADASVERSQANVKQAQDELNRAKSAYDIAELTYQRLDDVSKKQPGLVAQQEIDDAHSKALVAEAQVAAANSAVQSAEEQVRVNQSDVAKVHTMMDYTRVIAPFTGVVTKRYADKGSMIQAGTASQSQAMPVVRLSQNNLLRLILPVPESAVPTVHIGQQVEVRVPSLNRSFPAQVIRFEDKLYGFVPILSAFEDAGRCRRGYFVEGLGAAQFAVPERSTACGRWRRRRSGRTRSRHGPPRCRRVGRPATRSAGAAAVAGAGARRDRSGESRSAPLSPGRSAATAATAPGARPARWSCWSRVSW